MASIGKLIQEQVNQRKRQAAAQGERIAVVACGACQGETRFKESLRSREAEKGDAVEWGVVCSHCNAWTHTHFETKALKNKHKVLEQKKAAFESLPQGTPKEKAQRTWDAYKKAERGYKKFYTQTQRRLRSLNGVRRIRVKR